MAAQVIRLNLHSENDEFIRTSVEETIEISSTAGEDESSGYIDPKDLYPASDRLNPALSTAITLLEEGIGYIEFSLNMILDGDLISSDDAVQKFLVLLPELFCCRKLGDGFGTIISSIYQGLRNKMDSPLSEHHLKSILHILKRISTEPFIEYDEAIEELMNLELTGFEFSPQYFEIAADLLDE